MAWRKLGRIFAPSGELDWSRSHAALPVPEWIEGDIFRIYFSGRDGQNRSSIGSVIVDLAVGGRFWTFRRSRFCAPALEECLTTVGCQSDRLCVPAIRDFCTTRAGISLSPCPGKHHRRGD